MKLSLVTNFISNMGARYIFFRIYHMLLAKLGFQKVRFPIEPSKKELISLMDWRETNFNIFSFNDELERVRDKELEINATKILGGEIQFFSSDWKKLNREYNWLKNPTSGFIYDISKHWSIIPDLSSESGDIKFVWEKSRFTYLITILRYDFHFKKNNAEFIFSEVESWIDNNPINQGPNWICSQEISLRIFNWCFVLDYYKYDQALTEDRWNKIQNVIYWSIDHVYNNINFSRIAVRNNHAITETLFLSLSELLFPFITETKKWSKKGRKYFEEEINYQIYNDGTFLQHSMNYHRVVIQLLSLGITITEKFQKPFAKSIYEKAYKSLNFLFQSIQEENGFLPNYGANDGAWFFPLSTTDYRDYRPQLNSLHRVLTGEYLFEEEFLREDFLNVSLKANSMKVLKREMGIHTFDIGGYYISRDSKDFTFIKCGKYKDRPSQADNLHLDIWVKGINILRDSGSYKYNTDKEYVKYFNGTEGHNTVSVSGEDQMLKGGRFIWFYWVKKAKAFLNKNNNTYNFKGEIKAFKHVAPNIVHERSVKKTIGENLWQVNDNVKNKGNKKIYQYWHLDKKYLENIEIISKDEDGNLLKPLIEEKWYSGYYGVKERSVRLRFETNKSQFNTEIRITL
ncbi:heparinase [Tenacibaculum singaporense]|uniref:Heparinase n=1 Tax=Tenacibaculum singaporense TaxID=2358479 RepID=A0A3S8R5J4_9FLAO|nr:heparinase II/III-family protein [Tenacibaculum singaporense]AZJ35040.1 heparinase [Tenacibaculum singaporense]